MRLLRNSICMTLIAVSLCLFNACQAESKPRQSTAAVQSSDGGDSLVSKIASCRRTEGQMRDRLKKLLGKLEEGEKEPAGDSARSAASDVKQLIADSGKQLKRLRSLERHCRRLEKQVSKLKKEHQLLQKIMSGIDASTESYLYD